ncbi:MAG TPA: site-2 protease family protein [Marmoricola sp.]|nr:site-2 protease family protein [Marmoricola sp.]
MTALLYLLGVLVFAVGVAVSIGLHEVGHLYPAKKFGVKVTQYFVGFGNTVWSTRRGETEYGVKSIPLGGYVKLVGMLPPAKDDEEQRPRASNTGMFTQLISDARSAEYEHVRPEDEPRLFYRLPWWKKVVVMSGGPMVNLVIAFVLFAGVFGLHGTYEPTTTVGVVSECVVPAQEEGRACTAEDPRSPAVEAGLLPGDEIVRFNGEKVGGWRDLADAIRANEDGEAVIGYLRDGELRTATTSTTVKSVRSFEDDAAFVQAGFLGVSPTAVRERHGLLFTVREMGRMTWDTVEVLGQLPVKVWGVAKAVVGVEERAADSPVSVVGAGRIAGEVTSDTSNPVVERVVFLVTLLAGLNLFVGMFNFIPLLPLDGGHIAGALYEGARRGVAKVFRRPDPGFVDVGKLLPVAYVMAGALLVMSMVLIAGDIVAPVSLG